jgi:hypothetical protein
MKSAKPKNRPRPRQGGKRGLRGTLACYTHRQTLPLLTNRGHMLVRLRVISFQRPALRNAAQRLLGGFWARQGRAACCPMLELTLQPSQQTITLL